jgi:hypothetical protein
VEKPSFHTFLKQSSLKDHVQQDGLDNLIKGPGKDGLPHGLGYKGDFAMQGLALPLDVALEPEKNGQQSSEEKNEKSDPENGMPEGEGSIVTQNADKALGWEYCNGRSHLVSLVVASQAKFLLTHVLQGVVCQRDGHPGVVPTGKADLIGRGIQLHKFGNIMAGLALDPQVGGVLLPLFPVHGVAVHALGPCFRKVRGPGHIPVALDTGRVSMSGLFNETQVHVKGNNLFAHSSGTFFVAVALQAKDLRSKDPGIRLNVGEAVTVQAGPRFAVCLRRHRGACGCAGKAGEAKKAPKDQKNGERPCAYFPTGFFGHGFRHVSLMSFRLATSFLGLQ